MNCTLLRRSLTLWLATLVGTSAVQAAPAASAISTEQGTEQGKDQSKSSETPAAPATADTASTQEASNNADAGTDADGGSDTDSSADSDADAETDSTVASKTGGDALPLRAKVPKAPILPQYRADLGIDLGATTFFFYRGRTAFALEVSPRLAYLWQSGVEAGAYFVAGYDGPTRAWSQLTTMGIGGFAGFGVPVYTNLTFRPWLGVIYHYAFIEGLTNYTTEQNLPPFPQQSARFDLHADLDLAVSRFTELGLGLFVKAGVAPRGMDSGTATHMAYGLRLSATSTF